jgi:VanZ family protein
VADLRWLCRIAGWACAGAIFFLSVVPGEARPHSGVAPGHVEHVLAYLVTAVLIGLGHPRWRLQACALLIGFAAVLESVQIWIPGRNAEFNGFAASALGIVFGCAGVAALDRLVLSRGPK